MFNKAKFIRYLQNRDTSNVTALDASPDVSSVFNHPTDLEFESKHPRGNSTNKGQFRKSEKTLAKLDEADAAVAPHLQLPKDSSGREINLNALDPAEKHHLQEEAIARLRSSEYGTPEHNAANHDRLLYHDTKAVKCGPLDIPLNAEEISAKRRIWRSAFFQKPDGSVWRVETEMSKMEAFPIQNPGAVPYKTPDIVEAERKAAERKEQKKREKAEFVAKKRMFDKPYTEAVNAGDMQKAQEIVNEVAKLSGYSDDSSWRMSHQAPNAADGDTCLADIEVDENGRIVKQPPNSPIPEDFFSDYGQYLQGYEGEFSVAAEILSALKREARLRQKYPDGSRHARITLYRGVDKTKNAREGSFRNGDWVTPDYAYAKNEADDPSNEKPRIIKMTVPLNQVFWDVNSIMEMGYDDGNKYAYSDVLNNRKLLDPLTKDDNGKVIPVSKRFDKSKSDPRY